jgi:hypothetical protein
MPMCEKTLWYDAAGNLVENDDPARQVIAYPYGSEIPAGTVPAAFVPPAPTLTSILPVSGAVGLLTQLQLTGTNFTGNCVVFFNNQQIAGARVVSPTELQVSVVPNVAGTFPVEVRDTYGQATTASSFTVS